MNGHLGVVDMCQFDDVLAHGQRGEEKVTLGKGLRYPISLEAGTGYGDAGFRNRLEFRVQEPAFEVSRGFLGQADTGAGKNKKGDEEDI